MDDADRLHAQAEAEDPSLLPSGATLIPEIAAQRELEASPLAQQLMELHAFARQGTPADQPVPPERFAYVLGLHGLGGQVLAHLPALYEIDSAWMQGAALVRRKQVEDAKAARGAGR